MLVLHLVVVLVLSPCGASFITLLAVPFATLHIFFDCRLGLIVAFLNMGNGRVGCHNMCAVTTISRWRLRASGCCLLHGFLRRAFYRFIWSACRVTFSASSLFFSALLLLVFVPQVAVVSPPCVPMRSLLPKAALAIACVGLG
jgi:hypothetical protein